MLGIKYGYRVVLFVRYVNRIGRSIPPQGQKHHRQRPKSYHCIRHLVSGLSIPRVSNSENWCKNPGCGDTETRERPSASRIGWRSRPSQERKLSRAPLYAASSKRSLRPNTELTVGSLD